MMCGLSPQELSLLAVVIVSDLWLILMIIRFTRDRQ